MSDGMTMDDFASSIEGISQSSVFLNLFHQSMVNDPGADATPLFQIGLALMMDKPFIVLIDADDPLPEHLRRAADRVIVIDDMRHGGMERAFAELQTAIRELTPPSEEER